MYPIIAITGATGTNKTTLAVSVAQQTGATIFPLDQLHRYKHLEQGTGLESDLLRRVEHHGYQVLSPWEVSGPARYLVWLRDALGQIARTGPVVIEGGCTSYLNALLACRGDSVLGQVRVVALTPYSSSVLNRRRTERRFSREKVVAIVKETELLEANGFITESALPFLLACEQLWTHPEHADASLAWALRISARIYAPAYLALKGQLGDDAARARIIRNVLDIQEYQSGRIRTALPGEAIFRQRAVPTLAKQLVSQLLQDDEIASGPNTRMHPTAAAR